MLLPAPSPRTSASALHCRRGQRQRSASAGHARTGSTRPHVKGCPTKEISKDAGRRVNEGPVLYVRVSPCRATIRGGVAFPARVRDRQGKVLLVSRSHARGIARCGERATEAQVRARARSSAAPDEWRARSVLTAVDGRLSEQPQTSRPPRALVPHSRSARMCFVVMEPFISAKRFGLPCLNARASRRRC